MSTELPPVLRLPLRRNGKEQACEPCRKAKMRCDHSLPNCQNCKRRNLIEKCIYLEAPQTRPKSISKQSGTTLSPKSLNPAQINAYSQTARISAISAEQSPTAGELWKSTIVKKDGDTIFRPSAGFYGPTSFTAIFRENESQIGPLIDTTCNNGGMADTVGISDSLPQNTWSRTGIGVKLLNLIPNQATCDRLMELYATKGTDKSFHKPTIVYCMSSLWSTFGPTLRHPRKSKDLKDLAELLNRNTMTVIPYVEEGDVWLNELSGLKLRWEMIGILLSTLGFVLLATPEEDQFWSTQSGRRINRREFAFEMKECTDGCIKLSNQMDNINTLMVALLYRRNILESQCTGDSSLLLWRAQGELNNAATGLGLHREKHHNLITITQEMRRRTWACVFSTDKTVSAFTGRPPNLSHRYNHCALPLDLSDEILLAPREQLDLAISKLDDNGWNTEGNVTAATWSRAVMIHCLVLGEILELSLGSEDQYSSERVNELKLKNNRARESLPPWLYLTQETPGDSNLYWTCFTLRLRWLHCSLLLEQLSMRHPPHDQQHMLDIAREMLELTVYMWIERDRFLERTYDYDWMIMCYGIPASGVICVELLKQSKYPHSSILLLPRSEVIQNLSMLVGFLDWVRPTAANRQLCGRMSAVIKRILDKVLEPPTIANRTDTEGSADVLGQLMEYDFGQIDAGNFDWLGTVDWTQGPFVDMGLENAGFPQFS
ncbi:hypothetical protein BJ878DRAFT_519886 [Calycina marina]|uniref:Zn(2)-C6 fungal-type domain-containing protein n=1 Tax=Calycina marina TaxID=1763456 RepID=A0A9P7YXK7_9HELO|nr:hypothetical protein BJ878DRAFT_519886 [Calycina marina]